MVYYTNRNVKHHVIFYVTLVICAGWGATGTWVIDDQGDSNYGPQGYGQPQTDSRGGFGGGSPCWVPASNGMKTA